MRTTLDISDATLEALREEARRRRRPFREVVESTLVRGLAATATSPRKVELPAYPIGIKAAYQGLSMNQLYDQLEAEDGLRVAES